MWYSCDCCVTPTAVKIYPKRKLDSIWRKTNPFLMNELVILVVVWLSCDHFCLLYEELFIVGHNNGYMYIEQWSVASWMVRSTATIALCTHCFRSEKKHNKRNLPLVWNEGNLCFYSLSLCRGDGLSTLVVCKGHFEFILLNLPSLATGIDPRLDTFCASFSLATRSWSGNRSGNESSSFPVATALCQLHSTKPGIQHYFPLLEYQLSMFCR